MSNNGLANWLERFQEMPNDRPTKTLFVAFAVSIVCAVMVSGTAVFLKPLQQANKERERQQQILDIVARLPGVEELFETVEVHHVEAHVVELATGNYVRSIDPAEYDQRKASIDPQLSVAVTPEHDIANIQRHAKYATVYLVKSEGQIKLLILPVHGSGYASTLYGFLALEGDANTVVALSFFEHAETPGMGAKIDEPEWRDRWQGKKVWDEDNQLRIGVARGQVDPSMPSAPYEVDGISGATRTAQGVTNLLRFWLGDYGFGPYLEKIRSRRG
ncbi:MAG: Na(+)-translocating NADH-quinone reductase subunit C [Gammaproteobacteria bacterium]|nr:Na(+)-translocating NADH-quinone reductase subunit C [Gammaproteobacteria bacterium]